MLEKICVLMMLACTSLASSCPYGKCLYVTNKCSLDLWMDATTIDDSNGVVNRATPLVSGNSTIIDVTGWEGLPGQRLYAWWINPVVGYALDSTQFADKVEINICYTNQFCYNPTAVDYIALPVSIGPENPSDCPSVPYTGTLTRTLASVKSQCPTVWSTGAPWGVCRSSGYACAIDPSNSFCNSLSSTVNQCINDGICASGSTTEDAYECSNWFASQPGYCAAINRGVYPDLDQEDPSLFYQTAPYNTYSGWIHTDLTQEYAFPYDDYEAEDASGYEQCTTNSLQVIWCPAD